MTSAVYRTGDPIYDHDGKCLGVMTACGTCVYIPIREEDGGQ